MANSFDFSWSALVFMCAFFNTYYKIINYLKLNLNIVQLNENQELSRSFYRIQLPHCFRRVFLELNCLRCLNKLFFFLLLQVFCMEILVLFLQHVYPLLQLLGFLLILLLCDFKRILGDCLLFTNFIQTFLRDLNILNVQMAVYEIFNGKVFLGLFFLASKLIDTFLTLLLYSFLLELFETQWLFSKLFAFLYILSLQFPYCLLSLLQALLFLLMLGFQGFQYLFLFPDFFDYLCQFRSILILLLFLNELLLLSFDYGQIFNILVDLLNVCFFLFDVILHVQQIISSKLILGILLLQIFQFSLVILQHDLRIFQLFLKLFLQFFLINIILLGVLHILGSLLLDRLLEFLDVIRQFGLFILQLAYYLVLLLDFLQESCDLVLRFLHNKVINLFMKYNYDNDSNSTKYYETIPQLNPQQSSLSFQKIGQKQEWNLMADARASLQLMYQSESSFSQHDTLQLKTEPKFQCLLEGKEQVVLSTNIFKYNSQGKCQQRILVVTNFAILNILKSENIIKTFMKKFINFQNKYEIKRRILLSNLYGITITPNRSSNVFLIHVNQEHDYHYRAENNKMIVIKVIADQYKRLTKNPLQFFFKEQNLIGNYFTTKSHLKQKKDIKPKDSPIFLNDDYFFDKKMDNQNYVCEYSHNNQIVQPRNFKVVSPKDVKTGQSYFIKKDQQNRSIHVSSLNKENMLLNPYYTFYSDKKQVLFIPFMMGGNLKKFLSKKCPISQSDLVFYLKQVLIFLIEFHQKGKIYCNITLENLLVKENGYLMLNGLEKSIQQFKKDKPLYRVYGNPYYFPPEVIECRGYGPQIDVWKLGICAFILCKGFYPFHGNSTKELYYNIIHTSIENENVPEFVKAMLEKQKQKRIKVGQLLDLPQFNNQDINQVLNQQVKAPFLPNPNMWQTSLTTIYQLDHDSQ